MLRTYRKLNLLRFASGFTQKVSVFLRFSYDFSSRLEGKLTILKFWQTASSETQGQIKGARESLNGRENMARRKVKNGEKSPWGECLTRPVPNGRRRSGF